MFFVALVETGNDNVEEKIISETEIEKELTCEESFIRTKVEEARSLEKIVPISLGSSQTFDDVIDNVNFDDVKSE